MGGSFPTLGTANAKSASSNSGAVGAWGKPKVEAKSAVSSINATAGADGSWLRGVAVPSHESTPEDASSGSKKGNKKFTKVSLLSNSSSRSYR